MKFGKTNSNPSVDSGLADSVTIGQFTISQFSDGVLWMEDGDEGAMTVSEGELVAALKSFYDGNF